MSTTETYLMERKVLWDLMKKQCTQDVIGWYNKHSELYEQQFSYAGFQYPTYVMDTIADLVTDKRSIILDIGAGTGNFGEMLFKHGYSTIDAVDASEGMLAIAKKKNIYRSTIFAMVGTDIIKGLAEDTYDVIVGAGVFSLGTVQYHSIPMLMRYLKKGGYIVFNVDDSSMLIDPNLSAENLRLLTSMWEKGNLCKLIEQRAAFHINNESATVFVLQKI